MKILTVTANPCIDRMVVVSELEKGATNRVSRVSESINGKGINSSIAINNLGFETVAAVIEYSEGESVTEYLSSLGIKSISVPASGRLRVNTKIFDMSNSEVTELNCSGTPVGEDIEWNLEKLVLESVEAGDVLVVSGSVPPGIGTDFYKRLIEAARLKGAYTILDAAGDLLINGIKGCPDLIKPNREELSGICRRSVRAIDEAIDEARELISRGVGSVCISFGEKGALYVTAKSAYWADSVRVDVKGTVGAGDSMVAGFAIGYLKELSPIEAFKSAIALAAGTVSLDGTQICDAPLYVKMLGSVTVEELQ